MNLFTETVTVSHRTPVLDVDGQPVLDGYGNPTHTWSDTTSPAWVSAAGGGEDTDRREQSRALPTVYLPLGVEVAAVDRITWDGSTFEVDGDPARQPGGFRVPGYLRVALRLVTG